LRNAVYSNYSRTTFDSGRTQRFRKNSDIPEEPLFPEYPTYSGITRFFRNRGHSRKSS
jgi:hypothetical protein